jgi:transposase
MGRRAYSDDLRSLVVAEVAAGVSRRSAAERFKVSASSAIRWVERHAETGSVSPRKGRKPRSPLDGHAAWLLDLIAREADLTLAEIEQRLWADRGVRTSDSSIDRFFKRHKVSFKKKESARSRTRPSRRRRGTPKLEGRPGIA